MVATVATVATVAPVRILATLSSLLVRSFFVGRSLMSWRALGLFFDLSSSSMVFRWARSSSTRACSFVALRFEVSSSALTRSYSVFQ